MIPSQFEMNQRNLRRSKLERDSAGRNGPHPHPAVRESDVATEHWNIVARVQQFLRLAWDASEMREREWHIFAARQEFHSDTVYMPVVMERMRRRAEANEPLDDYMSPEEDALRLSVPALTPFEQAMHKFVT